MKYIFGWSLVFCLASTLISVPTVSAQDAIYYDGSSQMYWALVRDAAEAFYGETGVPVFAEDRRTQDAVPSLVGGRCNIGGMARKMKLTEKALGKDLAETLVARDHLAVFVPSGMGIDAISAEDLRKVFAGEITDWKELGEPCGPIRVVVPSVNTACARNFMELVMGDVPFSEKSIVTPTAGGVLEEARMRRAISFISYGAVSRRADYRCLKVDGKGPGDPMYPLAQDMYLVTEGPPMGNLKRFIDFLLTGNGKEIIAAAGLLPAREGPR